MRRVLGLLVAAFVLFGVVPSARATATEIKAEQRMIEFVNEYRLEKGKGDLHENEIIRKRARQHSTYMANEGGLSDDGEEARFAAIAVEDDGTDADRMCEIRAAIAKPRPRQAARIAVNAWINAGGEFKGCLIDKLGWTSESVGAGARFRDGIWWFTLIVAHDSSV
jgi:hypothetical protein